MNVSRIRLSVAVLLVLGISAVLPAHDFWIVPMDFQVNEGATLDVLGQTSSRFPTSESAVAVDRVEDARIISASAEERVTDLGHSGTSLRLRHRPTTAGQRVIAARLKWRSVRESAEGFRRYLRLEGATDALARLEQQGRLPGDSVTRRYAKYAKTLVEVGAHGPRAYSRRAGHPLEFVPLSDPSLLRSGGAIRVQLLFNDRPVAGAHVHAGPAPAASQEPARDVSLTTDANGVVEIRASSEGLWNARTIHIVPSPAGAGADWDAHWASIVFGVGERVSFRQESDSSAIASVVNRFHAALESGDSATALSLLAPDASILESGGIETREEYRSHHLPGDIAFARAVQSQRGALQVRVRGDVAWTIANSSTQGTYRERPIDSAGAELMVLARTANGWRISAIHWSSRQRRR